MLVALMMLIATTLLFGVWTSISESKRRELGREVRYLRRNNRDLLSRFENTPRAVCACSHGFGSHANGGRCMDWKHEPSFLGWATRADRCVCRKYTGPEPLPEFYHPLELGQ